MLVVDFHDISVAVVHESYQETLLILGNILGRMRFVE